MAHVLGVYYGGGYISGGVKLGLSIMENTQVSVDELRKLAEDEDGEALEDSGLDVDIEAVEDALEAFAKGGDAGSMHEISDSICIVATDVDAALKRLRSELLMEERNFDALAALVRAGSKESLLELTDVAQFAEYNEGDEEGFANAVREVCNYAEVEVDSERGKELAQRLREFEAYCKREKIGNYDERLQQNEE